MLFALAERHIDVRAASISDVAHLPHLGLAIHWRKHAGDGEANA
jgi:hypothetical protein